MNDNQWNRRRRVARVVASFVVVGLVSAACTKQEEEETLDLGGPGTFRSNLCGRTLSVNNTKLVGDVELGCTGMNVGLTGNLATSLTKVLTTEGEITGSAAPLCWMYMIPPLDSRMTNLGLTWDTADKPGHASIATAYEGSTWRIVDGCALWDSYEPTRAVGSYDAIASDNAGQAIRLRGKLDFCAYGYRADCPHSFYDEEAAKDLKQVTISAPLLGKQVTASAGDCRVLIDSATSGMQVDMEIAIYDGQHVSQIYQGACGSEIQSAPPANSFVFRSPGVTGSGSYGPWTSIQGSKYQLPGFEFTLPKIWFASNTIQACTVWPQVVLGQTTENSTCEFTVDASQNKFELKCSNTLFAGTERGTILSPLSTYEGNFSISMNCDVRMK